jgi:hypothetical protein
MRIARLQLVFLLGPPCHDQLTTGRRAGWPNRFDPLHYFDCSDRLSSKTRLFDADRIGRTGSLALPPRGVTDVTSPELEYVDKGLGKGILACPVHRRGEVAQLLVLPCRSGTASPRIVAAWQQQITLHPQGVSASSSTVTAAARGRIKSFGPALTFTGPPVTGRGLSAAVHRLGSLAVHGPASKVLSQGPADSAGG